MMNHTRWVAFAALLAVACLLVMSGCIRKAPDQIAPTLVEQNQSCEALNVPDARDACFFDSAVHFSTAAPCESIASESRRDDCRAQLGVVVMDSAVCTTVVDSGKQDACFQGVASATNKVALCAPIGDAPTQTACLESLISSVAVLSDCENFAGANQVSCLVALAKNTGLATACNGLSVESEKNDCLNRSAHEANLIDLCTQISDSAISNACIADLIGGSVSPTSCPLLESLAGRDACFSQLATQLVDESYCKRVIDIPARNACYSTIAQSKNDPLLCTQMAPTQLNDHPMDSCYDALGQSLKNTLLCYKVHDLGVRGSCLDAVVGSLQNADTNCMSIDEGSDEANNCYSNWAIQDNNVNICADSNDSVGCVAGYALYKGDPAICASTIYSYDDQFDCQSRYFIANEDALGCETITFSMWRYNCLAGVAPALNDESLCKEIPKSAIDPHSQCWVSMAYARHELALCDKSVDVALRASCYARVGAFISDPEACMLVPLTRDIGSERFHYRNACWIELAELSQNPGYCLKIDENSIYQQELCQCQLNGTCNQVGTLHVAVDSPEEDLSGYLVVLTRQLIFYGDYPVDLIDRSVDITLMDGNYGVDVVDREGNYVTDIQLIEILDGSSQSLNFTMVEDD